LRAEVRVGAPIIVEVSQTNNSDHEVLVWSNKYGPNYSIEVVKEDGNSAKDRKPGHGGGQPDPGSPEVPHHGAGGGACLKLRPGESRTERIDLGELFDMSQSGKYTVILVGSDPESWDEVKPEAITVTVTR
jgi:hypothetical protein